MKWIQLDVGCNSTAWRYSQPFHSSESIQQIVSTFNELELMEQNVKDETIQNTNTVIHQYFHNKKKMVEMVEMK